MTENSSSDDNLLALARLGAIVESSDDAMVGKTLDGVITSWNRSAEKIFGYTADEAMGQHITFIIPTDRYSEEDHIIGKIRAGERVEQFQTVRQRKDGSLVELSVSVSPIRDETGRIVGASKVARDISHVRAAERASAYLAAIIDSSDDAIISKNLNSVITSWNRSAERIFGYSAEDAIGQSIVMLIPAELRAEEDMIISKIRAGDRVDHFVTDRLTKAGDRITVSISVSPIYDGQGHLIGASKIARDVTEESRAARRQAALAQLTDEIRDIENPDDITYTAARILGETLMVSRAGYGLIDAARETITIERDWNAPGVESLAGVLHFRDYGNYVEDLKRGRTVVFNDADKDPRTWANAAALKAISAQSVVNMPVTEGGQAVALLYLNHATARTWSPSDLAFIREVAERTRTASERARAQSQLKALNEELEIRVAEALEEMRVLAEIIEATDVLIQVANTNYEWLAVNRAAADEFEKIFGVRPDVGGNMIEILAAQPQSQAAVREVWSRALAGETFTEVAEFGDPQRGRRYYEMRFTPLRDKAHNIIGAYQFVFDVTQRVEDQERLHQAEEQLRQAQKMEAVGQLTGGVAHDFNNMLAVVSGSLELLQRRASTDDTRTRGLITAALEASKRAGNLTQRLLAFSRQQPLQPEVLDPNRLVAGMSDLFRHSLGAQVQLETILAGGIWKICADQNQLENVLLNLAVNARDAMPEGGRLTIETQNASLDQRYVAKELGVSPGQYVMIAVTDTGTGMPPEVVAKAFDPFFTTKEVGKGTGLGLSQVYGFVKQSGGHIKIYSEPGNGTTIKIYLPRHIAIAEPMPDVPHDSSLPTAEDRELILVVDDEELVRQLSVGALSDLGYRVLEADSAQSALTILIERSDVDLLFTDIVMPEMNGRKLADLARERRPDLPVIYTTGYTRNAIVHNGVVDPGVEFLGKPFTLEDLATRVRDVLDKAALVKGATAPKA